MRFLKILAIVGLMSLAGCAEKLQGKCDLAGSRWSQTKASQWYARQSWLVGCNFIPSTAVNQLEMWQKETFDPNTIDKELGWAADLGFNVVRVYLHDLAYEQDAEGFLDRVEQFLDIAKKHDIRVMLVIFDDCWLADPQSGKQPEPWPGVHNSAWVESPGFEQLKRYSRDENLRRRLEKYVKAVLRRFASDERVLMWDLYNEPGGLWRTRGEKIGEYTRDRTGDYCLALLRDVYCWAREVGPSQPLTTCHYDPVQSHNAALKWADVITFHNYHGPEDIEQHIEMLKAEVPGRPIICTEYMARHRNNRFENCLPVFRRHNVGAINWGLVAGKTQTVYHWDSWDEPNPDPDPDLWFHDILRRDGTPYDPAEVAFIKSFIKNARKRQNAQDDAHTIVYGGTDPAQTYMIIDAARPGSSKEPVRYIGSEWADTNYHDGRLRPAVGVQSYEVMHCNRTHPGLADGYGWTYNHAPIIFY